MQMDPPGLDRLLPRDDCSDPDLPNEVPRAVLSRILTTDLFLATQRQTLRKVVSRALMALLRQGMAFVPKLMNAPSLSSLG